jgi:pimeloyl-ACP methyl ester carboxylesterase
VSPVEQRLAEADDGTRLRVLVRSGDVTQVPFVLVHGLASNARLWDQVAEGLNLMGHPTYAVDQRGHGESERPDSVYGVATAADDLASVVRDVVRRRAVLVGQSWGGNVVIETAARYPELAEAVLCVDGGFIRLPEAFPDRDAALAALTPPQFEGLAMSQLEEMASSWFGGFPRSGIDAQLANFEERADGTVSPRLSFDRHMAIVADLWNHDPDRMAAGLRIPVWVLAARDGWPGKSDRLAAFSSRLHRGRVEWIDAHHDIHAEQPQAVVELLLDLAVELES